MLKTLIKIRLLGIFKRQRDVKKKKTLLKKIGFGYLILYIVGVFGFMLVSFFSSLYDALIPVNLGWFYFAIMAIMTLVLCFVGSVFMVQQELYNAKDNDLLLSMPICHRDILLSRIFSVLVINYLYESLIVLPAIGVYIFYSSFHFITCFIFIIVFITLPLFSLALSCLFGWLLAMIIRKFQRTTAITLIVSIIAMVIYMYGVNQMPRYVMSFIARAADMARGLRSALFPFYHLGQAIMETNMISLMIYLVCEIVPFLLVYFVLSSNFIHITIKTNGIKKRKVKAQDYQLNSIKMALLKREMKHFFSNAMVILNGCAGLLFAIVIGGYMIFYSHDINAMIASLSNDFGFDVSPYLMPIATLAIISSTAFVTISSFMISLEGKHFWIIKSLPIQAIDILESKLYLHYLLSMPACLILSIIFIVLLPMNLFDIVLVIATPIVFCVFSGLAGILINLYKPKFEWVNETVVVKQSMSVTVTLFGQMALVILLGGGGIFFVRVMPLIYYVGFVTLIFIGVDILLYRLLRTWGIKRFEEL